MPAININPLLNKKDKRMYIINQHNKGSEAIFVTMTPTAGFTVGFNLTFSGSVFIDFKDGGGKEALTSGVEKTHLYASAGTYIAEITGNLSNITNFIADTSRITVISDLKTGLLTDIALFSNLLTSLDFSNSPLSSSIRCATNSNLTSVTFATSGNSLVSSTSFASCNLSTIDFSNVPLSGIIFLNNNTGLTSANFSNASNGLATDLRLFTCNFNTLDFSLLPVSNSVDARGCSNLTSVTFATSGNSLVTNLDFANCNLSSLDCSNVPLGTDILLGNNNISTFTTQASGNSALSNFQLHNNNIPNFDFSVFPSSDGVSILLYGNSFTATEHDNQLINLDSTGWINGSLQIITGNTARTAASDTAYNNLISNGWTIT